MIINWGRAAALRRAKTIISSRKPDFVIGPEDDLYMERWILLPRNWLGNVYIHKLNRSDDDRALHDHPRANISWVLQGGYWEHRFVKPNRFMTMLLIWKHWVPPGAIKARWAKTAHRLELESAQWSETPITIFLVGPRTRDWGFHCPQGWRRWQDYVSERPGGNAIGKGCED